MIKKTQADAFGRRDLIDTIHTLQQCEPVAGQLLKITLLLGQLVSKENAGARKEEISARVAKIIEQLPTPEKRRR
jgi:FKBP-type peptidyl-prolyl cis-trans isomerase (trigger factor)